jgi:glycosyltransferase involved in cell wall biosynthesis
MADGQLVLGGSAELLSQSDGGRSTVPGFDIEGTVPSWADPSIRRGVATLGLYGRRARMAWGASLAVSALPDRVGEPLTAGVDGLRVRLQRAKRREPGVLDPRIRPEDLVLITGADWSAGLVDILARTPTQSRPRTWVLIHDLLPVAHPELLCNDDLTFRFRLWLRSVAQTAEHVLFVSEHSRCDFDSFLADEGLDAVATSVLRPAPWPHDAQAAAQEPAIRPPRPFVVYVSTLERRKNHVVLLQAVRSGVRRGEPVPHLVLVGSWGWGTDDLRQELARDASLADHVVHLSGLPDAQMRWLVENASAVVFPSRFEGFGLPVAEAREWGTPVIAADIPALREVLGEGAWFVDPDDSGAWRDALVRVARGVRPQAGEPRHRSWTDAARELADRMVADPPASDAGSQGGGSPLTPDT